MSQIPRLLCVLFADVAGSTRLYETLGDTEALRAIGRCLDIMNSATALFKGQVIKTIGDEVMSVFATAEAGMLAACEMQQRIDELPLLSGKKLAIRIGFHYGPVLQENNDVFGDSVNVAARMTALAKAKQIIICGETLAALPPHLRHATRVLDALSIKGKSENLQIVEVFWQESDDLTIKAPGTAHSTDHGASLRLLHNGRKIMMGPEKRSVALGRDANIDIAIMDQRASRSHARIEFRRDKFVLIDLSTNGTYVTFEGEKEIILKREELVLRGRGLICFGRAWTSNATEFVAFEMM